jgi:hypothetical protein
VNVWVKCGKLMMQIRMSDVCVFVGAMDDVRSERVQDEWMDGDVHENWMKWMGNALRSMSGRCSTFFAPHVQEKGWITTKSDLIRSFWGK